MYGDGKVGGWSLCGVTAPRLELRAREQRSATRMVDQVDLRDPSVGQHRSQHVVSEREIAHQALEASVSSEREFRSHVSVPDRDLYAPGVSAPRQIDRDQRGAAADKIGTARQDRDREAG